MNRFIKLFLVTITLTCISCTTGSASLNRVKEKTESTEIHFTQTDSELFYYSDIIKKNENPQYITYTGSTIIGDTELNDSNIIGITMIESNKLLSSDRDGNITFYRKSGNIWKSERKLSVKSDTTFSAFSADVNYLCLYSGITDSIYMFRYSEKPSFVLKLFSENFSREITDMDIKTGYIYLIDTENRISIIDYRKRQFETEFILESKLPLRSISVINDKDSSSLAALSPVSKDVFIYPLSEQYMMINEKGFIKKAGITSFNYGTHVLVSDNGEILYALKSRIKNLSDYTKGEVSVTGMLLQDYPVDGGPEFLSVSDVKR